MNRRMKCTTLEVEVFPDKSDDASAFLDDEITAVRAVDANLNDLNAYEKTVSTMPIDKLRNQVSQLSSLVTSLTEELEEVELEDLDIDDDEPSINWARERKQLLKIAEAKRKIAQSYLKLAENF